MPATDAETHQNLAVAPVEACSCYGCCCCCTALSPVIVIGVASVVLRVVLR